MPTAEQFRAAAYVLRCAVDEADKARGWAVRAEGDHGLTGGQLAARVAELLSAPVATAGVVKQRYEELAGVCDERAVACDQYAAQLSQAYTDREAWIRTETDSAAWEQREPNLDGAPGVPSPPASWVEL